MVSKKIVLMLLLATLAGCGAGAVDVQTSGVTAARILSISISPADPTIAKNTSLQFTATGIYSDNSTRDLTASATWSSSDTSIASTQDATQASADGLLASPTNKGGGKAYAYGKNAGKTTITATSGDTSGSTTITVTNATLMSLSVTPANPGIAAGTTQQFTATGTFSDNTTQDLTVNNVTWTSSNTGIATIGASGLATSVAAGTTTVTASLGSIPGSTTLTVSAVVTGSATLAWDAPTAYTDGTPAVIAGYKVHYGTSSGNYTTVLDIGNVTTYTVNNLPPGTYFFTVTAYDASGTESSYPGEVSKTIQ